MVYNIKCSAVINDLIQRNRIENAKLATERLANFRQHEQGNHLWQTCLEPFALNVCLLCRVTNGRRKAKCKTIRKLLYVGWNRVPKVGPRFFGWK